MTKILIAILIFLGLIFAMQKKPKQLQVQGMIKDNVHYIKDLSGKYVPAELRGNSIYYQGVYIGEVQTK